MYSTSPVDVAAYYLAVGVVVDFEDLQNSLQLWAYDGENADVYRRVAGQRRLLLCETQSEADRGDSGKARCATKAFILSTP